MADDRTTVTELITGLGTLGFERLDQALAARPAEMVSVSPEQWGQLEELYRGGVYDDEFQAAWASGVAFFEAGEALRRRRPLRVEWRGGTKQPGDEPVPADLRIDRVYLVSCKYLSKIVTNSSPAAVFDRLLAGGHGGRSGDWYAEVAPTAYDDLYRCVLAHLDGAPVPAPPPVASEAGDLLDPLDQLDRPTLFDLGPRHPLEAGVRTPPAVDSAGGRVPDGLPESVCNLDPDQRNRLKAALGGGRWARPLRPAAERFSKAVAEASAHRWREALAVADRERALWRLLRIGSAPYFVLGMAKQPLADDPLRLRIDTAWDWRQQFELKAFEVGAGTAEQPVVSWRADITHRRSRARSVIEGHVEIRWSHGKFAQPPEAKVYLDTPHHDIPGYWPLS